MAPQTERSSPRLKCVFWWMCAFVCFFFLSLFFFHFVLPRSSRNRKSCDLKVEGIGTKGGGVCLGVRIAAAAENPMTCITHSSATVQSASLFPCFSSRLFSSTRWPTPGTWFPIKRVDSHVCCLLQLSFLSDQHMTQLELSHMTYSMLWLYYDIRTEVKSLLHLCLA